MKNAVIFDTALGTGNIGDEIIFDAISRNMSSVFDSCFTLRLATHVSNFTALQLLKPTPKIRYFQNADYKFICGTNLIDQRESGRVHSQWALYPTNLSLYKNSILVGAGTRFKQTELNFIAREMYSRILSHDFAHSVRDELTKTIIENLGFEAINTGCPTLWEFTPERCGEIPRDKADNCIFSVSGYDSQQDREKDQRMVDIVSRNYRRKWAWIQTIKDETYLESLSGTEDIERIYSLNAFREIAKRGDADYVGTRLHGGIFAMQNNCRTIIIGIDHRADGFNKTNHIPVVRRKDLETKLEHAINTSFETRIVIDEERIRQFREQFR